MVRGSAAKWTESTSPESPVGGAFLATQEMATPLKKTRRAHRGALTASACVRCRTKKVKCNGAHSSCSRCLHDSEPCVYDVPHEGMTKMTYLQQELNRLANASNDLARLFQCLRWRPDDEAAALLARLRLGESVGSIVANLDWLQDVPSIDSMRDSQSETSANSKRDATDSNFVDGAQCESVPVMPMKYAAPHVHGASGNHEGVDVQEMWRRWEEANLEWEGGVLSPVMSREI